MSSPRKNDAVWSTQLLRRLATGWQPVLRYMKVDSCTVESAVLWLQVGATCGVLIAALAFPSLSALIALFVALSALHAYIGAREVLHRRRLLRCPWLK